MPTFRCPHCENEITSLDYSVSTRQYGSCGVELINEYPQVCDWNVHDDEWEDEPDYICPECDNTLSLSDIVIEGAPHESNTDASSRHIGHIDANEAVDVQFCSACHELKETHELNSDGICENCETKNLLNL